MINRKKSAVKKSAVKKSAVKKKDNIHKDNKSHNVNIKVVSGIDDLKKYSEFLRQERICLESIERVEKDNNYTKKLKKLILSDLKRTLRSIKQQKAIQKKLI